jgi:c-di-GMP-related signal transduction protein
LRAVGYEAGWEKGAVLTDTLVARQPILDSKLKVVAYELLYRSSRTSQVYDGTSSSQATSHVIANSLFSIGLEKLAMGKRAFINFDRDLLVQGYASILPPQSVVIEILETVEPDDEVIAACQKLKQGGYQLAVDDYVFEERFNPFVELADIVKVDVLCAEEARQRKGIGVLIARGLKMLAEKVETLEQYEFARSLGYTYFQGYFFARPASIGGKDVPVGKLHHWTLLQAIQQSPLDYKELERVTRHEVSFAYKLLRYINSARFTWCGKIKSLEQALLFLGEDEVRKWASLAALSGIAEGKPPVLVALALVRARFCELLGGLAGLSGRSSDLFLMGMFSLMDALMDRGLEELLAGLGLDDEVKTALLETGLRPGPFAAIYQLARAYEAGEWNRVATVAHRLRLSEDALPSLYGSSVEWAETAFSA